jgi:hypothetical protein
MVRPTFLVVEPEPGNALSTRKLVLETAKFNVLTAHSWREADELFDLFPRVDAVIVTREVDNGGDCAEFISRVKERNPAPTAIFLTPQDGRTCDGVDHVISSHEPQALVELMRSLFGDPRPEVSHP